MLRFILDTNFSILIMKYKDITYTIGVSEKLKTIKVRYVNNDYIEFDTNIGVESYEILEGLEDRLSVRQLNSLKSILPLLTVENIEVRCI